MARRRSRSPRRRFGVWGAVAAFLGGGRRTTERTTRATTSRSGNNARRNEQDGGRSSRAGTSDRRRRDEASNAGSARPDSPNTVQRWVNAVPSRAAPPSQVSAPASSRHQSQSSRTQNATYGQYTRGRPSDRQTSHQHSESEESESSRSRASSHGRNRNRNRNRNRGSHSRHDDGHNAHHEEMSIRYPINSLNPMDAPQIQYSSGRQPYVGQEDLFLQYPTYSSNPMDAPQFVYGSGRQDPRDRRRR
jgi:hypothetical protein